MSLTTTDKQDIKVMINQGIEESPLINGIKDNLHNLEGKFDGLELRFEGLDTRVYRVEVLLEDTYSTVKHMIEMISDNLKVKSRVDNHEARLTDVETKQPMIISTLALHSKQLKTL